MKIKQCTQCRNIFQAYGNESVCPSCMEKMDQYFVKVRDYLYEHPNAGIVEIVEKTEVEEKHILSFLREERLSLKEPTGALVCANCGEPIRKGKYCEKCLISIKKEIDRVIPDAAGEKRDSLNNKDKMHLRMGEWVRRYD